MNSVFFGAAGQAFFTGHNLLGTSLLVAGILATVRKAYR